MKTLHARFLHTQNPVVWQNHCELSTLHAVRLFSGPSAIIILIVYLALDGKGGFNQLMRYARGEKRVSSLEKRVSSFKKRVSS